MRDVAMYLKNNGVKPSLQRIKIYEYLKGTYEHPTVDKIYRDLIGDIPTLSKTTVYNTLNLFIDANIANTVIIEENEVRYDAKKEPHGHFKCKSCGKVYDIKVDFKSMDLTKLGNIRIDETHFYLKGLCEACGKKAD